MSNFTVKNLLDLLDPEQLRLLAALQANAATNAESSSTPQTGTSSNLQQSALSAQLPTLQQTVTQATPPTPEKAEEMTSAPAKQPVVFGSNSLLLHSPQDKSEDNSAQPIPLPPKRIKVDEAATNELDAPGPMPAFPSHSPPSTSTPKPVMQQTTCIDLSLPPKQGTSSDLPQTNTTLPFIPPPSSFIFDTSSKLRQQLLQPSVMQDFPELSTGPQLQPNLFTIPNYFLLQQLAASMTLPDSAKFCPAPVDEQPKAQEGLSEAQRQGRRRVLFTPYQISEMTKCYNKKNYVSLSEREELARRINLTGTQVKIWFQNHRYKTKRAGGKVSANMGSPSQPKIAKLEGSIPSTDSWDSSPSESLGRGETSQSQQESQPTANQVEQAPSVKCDNASAKRKQLFRTLAKMLEDMLRAKADANHDDEDENEKNLAELTKRVIRLLYESSMD